MKYAHKKNKIEMTYRWPFKIMIQHYIRCDEHEHELGLSSYEEYFSLLNIGQHHLLFTDQRQFAYVS